MSALLCCARSAGLRAGQPVREMATLKEISNRLKSVKNIQKITKSMKMVSAAKFSRAERELRPARTFGQGATALYGQLETEEVQEATDRVLLVMSSDRGLCGGIHSSLVKAVRAELGETKDQCKLLIVGDKARQILQATHPNKFALTFNEYGRLPPTFSDASFVAQQLLESGLEYKKGTIFYNQFKTVVSYSSSRMGFVSHSALSGSEKLLEYDSVDAEVLRDYAEFSLAAMVYGAMKEGAASEQSSRMTAMEGASKNAGEMISSLTLKFNRTRQAVITRELIEIISGAAALD